MHYPQIQQSMDGLNAMRARSQLATAEFYAMIGKEPPVDAVRFQVVPKGVSAFHIVDRTSGKVRGFRFEYARAVEFALTLEQRAADVWVSLSKGTGQ